MIQISSKFHKAMAVYKLEGLSGVIRIIKRKLRNPSVAPIPVSAAATSTAPQPATESQSFQAPVINIADEYTGWLYAANSGWLEIGNLYCFDFAIKNLPDNSPILEIGSFCGLSTNALAYYKWRHRKSNHIFSCDRWILSADPTVGGTPMTYSDYGKFIKESFMRNVQMFSWEELPHTIELYSEELFEAWAANQTVSDVFGRSTKLGGTLSFCYIDGNHSYASAKRDFENCDKFLVQGGYILFDDSGDNSVWRDVGKVAKEVEATGRYELVIKNPNYLFRKK